MVGTGGNSEDLGNTGGVRGFLDSSCYGTRRTSSGSIDETWLLGSHPRFRACSATCLPLATTSSPSHHPLAGSRLYILILSPASKER